ncbi:MAG: hypothetical protein KAW09_03625, partial [Thermoplasmata archaeon]|nr:hypothetical protein [Thermoplasmata archaeon]
MSMENESANEIVVERSYRRTIFIAVFGLVALAALMMMSSEPAEAYTVSGTETWSTPQLWFEDVVVAPGGDLTIINTDVYMAPTFDGEWMFEVQNGGTLTVINSNITTFLGPIYYDFVLWDGSTVAFIDSHVSWVGGGFFPGMFVATGDITMNGFSLTDSQMIGLFYVNDTMGFTMSNSYVADNPFTGVYIVDGGATDYTFNFQGGTLIENNGMVGIYVDFLTNTNLALNLQNTAIRGHNYGIWIEEVGDAFASLDFTSSDISGNFDANVWVDDIVNGDLSISAFDTHFDASPNGYGLYVNRLGGALGANLSVMMDSSFVMFNGDDGIYVNIVSNGWMTFDFVNTFVELNGMMMGGYGIWTPLIAPDNVLIFNAMGSSFSGNTWSGIYISPARPGSIYIDVDNCDLVFNGIYGMEVGRVGGGDKFVSVRNSRFEGNLAPEGAIVDWGIDNGTVNYNIDNNEFNNSYAGFYLGSSFQANPGYGHTLTFAFTNNWLVSNLGEYGVRFGAAVQNFDDTVMTFTGNHFWGMETRDYGIYFAQIIRGDQNYLSNLILGINNNEFGELDAYGVRIWEIYMFWNVNFNFNNNVLWDTDGDYEYGLHSRVIYSDFGVDSYLNLMANGNQFYGMSEHGMY